MDLGTVKAKFDRREYANPEAFAADVRQIFANCFKYNPDGHDVVAMAKKLQQFFEEKFANCPAEGSAAATAPAAAAPLDFEPPQLPVSPPMGRSQTGGRKAAAAAAAAVKAEAAIKEEPMVSNREKKRSVRSV